MRKQIEAAIKELDKQDQDSDMSENVYYPELRSIFQAMLNAEPEAKESTEDKLWRIFKYWDTKVEGQKTKRNLLDKVTNLLEESKYDSGTVKKEKFVPLNGMPWFYISDRITVNRSMIVMPADSDMISNGNCFRTREEAEIAVGKIKRVLEGL